jgi:3-dehydroquinate dehydratase-2
MILVLNGPNLGRLGKRDSAVYGTFTYDDLVAACEATAAEVDVKVDVRQTDSESTMLGWVHDAADSGAHVVLNAGAWTHTSYALRDAAVELGDRLIEVHLSQIAAREEFRHHSVISAVARGTVTGLGIEGYRAAIRAFAAMT